MGIASAAAGHTASVEPLQLFKPTELNPSVPAIQGDAGVDEVEPVAEVSHGVIDKDRENPAVMHGNVAENEGEEDDLNVAESGSGLKVSVVLLPQCQSRF